MLYIVATPIGNLQDFSYRAVEILRTVDLIIAEDTRRSKILLDHYSINNKIISLHEHNEITWLDELILMLQQGKNLALISDAGTPLVSDPGYHLVKKAHLAKIQVSPIPGASALLAAISVSGLATDRFTFVGFLSPKLIAKKQSLIELSNRTETMLFFEAPHRIIETLNCMREIFGSDRELTFCRELTKKFETIVRGDLGQILDLVTQDKHHQTKGEIVLVVAGIKGQDQHKVIDQHTHKMLEILANELPLTQAARILAKITGIAKQDLYDYWLTVRT